MKNKNHKNIVKYYRNININDENKIKLNYSVILLVMEVYVEKEYIK